MKTLCQSCKAINPAEAPRCHNCGERIALGPSDATACSLPPHTAEKGFLAAGSSKIWWTIRAKDGYRQIGLGGETLKAARENARQAIREANSELSQP